MLKQNSTLQPGFNFIEMMVALTIIAIIIGMIGPRVMGLLGRGRSTSTKNTLKVVATGIKQYHIDVGNYPNSLEDLVRKPENASNWQGPYVGNEEEGVPAIPADAWGQALQYKHNGRGAVPPFELYSLGDPEKEEDRISYAK